MTTAERLSTIVASIERRSLRGVTRVELRELPALYRRLVSGLAEARARGASADSLSRLEALVLRAHGVLYAPVPVRFGRALGDLLVQFPEAVHRSRRYVVIAAALLAIGCAWGYAEILRNPSSAPILLPGRLQQNAEQAFQDGMVVREGNPVYGVFYFTNNARVALNAYALGATFGVGTVLVLLFNGVVLGASFGVVSMMGSPRAFLGFVLPHGGVELGAIVIAAAAGLQMADGLLSPGWRRRRDSFLHAAREALPLALGAAALLAVAGIVEGWVSPMDFPLVGKALIGGALDALLVIYLVQGGRRRT